MKNRKKLIIKNTLFLMILSSLVGCSSFGKSNESRQVDNKLIIPPTLKVPENLSKGANTRKVVRAKSYNRQGQARGTKAVARSNKNYYIIVGTYPDHGEALDTFVRLSSIGLEGATMESRKTKSGRNLHMVRLGPFNNQEDIDKAKDSLTSDGLSQFKVVVN
jgi:cell division protein FtsN